MKEAEQSLRCSPVTIQLFLPALLLNYIATESFPGAGRSHPLSIWKSISSGHPHSPHSLPDLLRLGWFRSPVFANRHDARHNYRRDYDKSRRNYASHNHERWLSLLLLPRRRLGRLRILHGWAHLACVLSKYKIVIWLIPSSVGDNRMSPIQFKWFVFLPLLDCGDLLWNLIIDWGRGFSSPSRQFASRPFFDPFIDSIELFSNSTNSPYAIIGLCTRILSRTTGSLRPFAFTE